MSDAARFDDADRAAVYRAIHTRRDVRTGFSSREISDDVQRRILEAAHAAPSVGLMQPWRIIRIKDPARRLEVYEQVQAERTKTADALGGRREEFLRLRVEGLQECAEVWAITLMPGREDHVFGRRTIPEMDVASAGCAVENLWLAARAEGIGLGWVSLVEPDRISSLLELPHGSTPLGVLCLGYIESFDERPMLEVSGWAAREELASVVFDDTYGTASSLGPPR